MVGAGRGSFPFRLFPAGPTWPRTAGGNSAALLDAGLKGPAAPGTGARRRRRWQPRRLQRSRRRRPGPRSLPRRARRWPRQRSRRRRSSHSGSLPILSPGHSTAGARFFSSGLKSWGTRASRPGLADPLFSPCAGSHMLARPWLRWKPQNDPLFGFGFRWQRSPLRFWLGLGSGG